MAALHRTVASTRRGERSTGLGQATVNRRGFSSVEIAAGIAVLGSLLAVGIPAFLRNLQASHLTEATDGLARIQKGAIAYATDRHALPPGAPLTPNVVPRGERVVDPEGVWEQPGWQAVQFRAAPEGLSHRFAFAMDVHDGSVPELVAHAHADLDGDGIVSTFEARVRQEGGSAQAVPGLIVENDLE